MISKNVLDNMVRIVNSFPDLSGCQVALYGNNHCAMLSEGRPVTSNFGNVMIMIEEVRVTDAAVNDDTAHWMSVPGGASTPGSPNAKVITNESRLGAELVGMGISCSMTVVSGGLVVVGGAFTIPTGGAAVALFVAGWVGLAMNAVQCGNAIARVMEASDHPKDDSLAMLDNDKTYQTINLLVDAIGVATAVASLPSGVKSLLKLLKTQRYWAARGLTDAGFKGTSRAERLVIMRQLVKEASATPEGRKVVDAALKEAGMASALPAGSVVVKSAATRVLKAVSANTLKQLHIAMLSVGSGIVGPSVSSLRSEMVGSASGSVNWIIHVLDGSD